MKATAGQCLHQKFSYPYSRGGRVKSLQWTECELCHDTKWDSSFTVVEGFLLFWCFCFLIVRIFNGKGRTSRWGTVSDNRQKGCEYKKYSKELVIKVRKKKIYLKAYDVWSSVSGLSCFPYCLLLNCTASSSSSAQRWGHSPASLTWGYAGPHGSEQCCGTPVGLINVKPDVKPIINEHFYVLATGGFGPGADNWRQYSIFMFGWSTSALWKQ